MVSRLKRMFSNSRKLATLCVASSMLVVPFVCTKSNSAVAMSVVQSFRMPDTPFLPPYTGRIVAGASAVKPQNDGGISYSITFEVAEQPSTVFNWYKAAFQLYDWTLDSDPNSVFRIVARHGNNIDIKIFLMSPRKAGACTQVQLYYRYVGKDL